jgi:hypothetical protein
LAVEAGLANRVRAFNDFDFGAITFDSTLSELVGDQLVTADKFF